MMIKKHSLLFLTVLLSAVLIIPAYAHASNQPQQRGGNFPQAQHALSDLKDAKANVQAISAVDRTGHLVKAQRDIDRAIESIEKFISGSR